MYRFLYTVRTLWQYGLASHLLCCHYTCKICYWASLVAQWLRICLLGTSLVAQWLKICLPMQGTWVRALLWEDLTCHGAARPVRHSCWAWALDPESHNYWARVPQLLKPARLEPVLRNKRSNCSERPAHRNEEWLPLTATGESPCTATATKTPRSQK